MTYTIRRAVPSDWEQIPPLYAQARRFMHENGNPDQWGESFPPEELLRQDIAKGQLYVVEEGCQIHGAFAFIIGRDPSYARIEDGAWLSEAEYGTLHRVAGDGKAHGLFDAMVAYCERQIPHLRVDTHADNRVMRHLIQKNGFAYCGIIHVEDQTPRLAFEKILEPGDGQRMEEGGRSGCV